MEHNSKAGNKEHTQQPPLTDTTTNNKDVESSENQSTFDKNTPDISLQPHKTMSKWEVIKQAFSLLGQIQNMKKFAEAAEQMEQSIAPVILAGILTMIIFISLCMTGVFLALKASGL